MSQVEKNRIAFVVTLLAMLLFWWLAVQTALAKSLTSDEPIHMMRGIALIQTGELRFQFEHPPLTHRSMGLLQRLEPAIPNLRQLPTWEHGDRIQIANNLYAEMNAVSIERVTFLSRLAIILWGMVLMAVIYRWAKQLGGVWTGMVGVLLLASSPNFLASSALATTDALSAITMTLAVYGIWQYGRRPTWHMCLLAGVTLGLGLSTKLTAVLLLPIAGGILLVYWWQRQPLLHIVGNGLKLLPIALFVLWAAYGFELRPPASFNVPIPAATYVENFLTLQSHVEGGHHTYLLGERSEEGWWHYFAVAFLVKTPLPTLLLLVGSILLQCMLIGKGWGRVIFTLWLPIGLIFAAATYSRLNIGYRHILAILPFVWLMIADGFGRISLPLAKWTTIILLSWQLIGTIRQHPHHLAYFNDAVGGSENGRAYLGDSNLDWGQDAFLLADALADDPSLNVSYNSGSILANYDITTMPHNLETGQFDNFAPANPASGRYALGASQIQGITLREPDSFDWFRRQTPMGHLGYSIWLYDVQAVDGNWVAHCNQPAPLLEPAFAEGQIGKSGLRHLYFDCLNSWVIPTGGTGWYIVPPNTDVSGVVDLGIPLEKVYVHAATGLAPAFEVWRLVSADLNLTTHLNTTATLTNGDPITLPYPIGNTATLLGYQHNGNRWVTAWQAQTNAPATLSTLIHFYGDAPTPIHVADSLGYTSSQWQTGDIWLQYQQHPKEAVVNYLETTLYDFVSGDRVEERALHLLKTR